MTRALLVYNPSAGRFPSWILTERAAQILEKHGWEMTLKKAESGEHITSLAEEAVAAEMDALLVVGGDGSVNRALSPLLGSHTALGVLPAGTANVWAQEIGLPALGWTRWLALEESARLLVEGRTWDVDVGVCNQTPFLLWAGVGLDAFVVRRIEPRTRPQKNLAVVQYAASALWNATGWEGMNLRVRSDGDEVRGHFLLAVISNIRLYAGGLAKISPNARLDDGAMDLWLFEGNSMADTVQRAWDLWAGKHAQSEYVHCIPIQKATLESESPLYVQVDGEPLEAQARVEIEIHTRALRILLPKNTPHTLFTDSESHEVNAFEENQSRHLS